MSAAAAIPLRSTDLDSEIALISSPETRSLLGVIGCSRWPVRELPDARSASVEIGERDCAVVICGTADWRDVIKQARTAERQPGVIVVADKANDFEWLQVLEAGGHYMPLDKLIPSHLFSLVNILWRSWHQS